MPRAVETKKGEDPMLSVWTDKVRKRRIDDKYLKAAITYTVKDASNHFIKKNKMDKNKATLYEKVVSEYFLELSKNIIQKNYPYTWYRVGEFFIAKFRGSPIINPLKSLELKAVISYVNLHTSGWVYKFYWAKKRCIFYNRDIYEFKPYTGIDEICGKKGVKKWIKKLHDDNKLTDYNAFVRNDAMQWKRRKKREANNEKKKLEKEQNLKNLLK